MLDFRLGGFGQHARKEALIHLAFENSIPQDAANFPICALRKSLLPNAIGRVFAVFGVVHPGCRSLDSFPIKFIVR
jgi:hypothetical protein